MAPIELEPDGWYIVKLRSERMLMRGNHAMELRDLLGFAISARPDTEKKDRWILGSKYRPTFVALKDCEDDR